MPKIVSALLCIALCATLVLPASAADSVQANAEKYAASHKRVDVTLADGTKTSGTIASTTAESFVLREQKAGAERTIPYSSVSKINKHGMSTGAKVGIGVGVAAAVVIVSIGLAIRGLGKGIH